MTTHPETPADREQLAQAVACWEEALKWILKDWDCADEYTHGILARDMLQELLDRQSAPLPADLQQRIEAADARFQAATEYFPYCLHTTSRCSDPLRQWYFFRYPLELKVVECHENNPEFRAFLHFTSGER